MYKTEKGKSPVADADLERGGGGGEGGEIPVSKKFFWHCSKIFRTYKIVY